MDFEFINQCWPNTCLSTVAEHYFDYAKLYILLFKENSVILFCKNNVSIYLIILSDFDNLKLDKILECFV